MTRSFKDYMAQRQAVITAMADAAIATGLPVFPCGPTKQPMTAHGFKDASADPDTIRRMFGPTATMIGCPTGEATGFVVVDVDVKENRQGSAWLNANSHRMPQTRTIRTGSGGLHLYFKWPGQRVKNQNDKIAPGIDIRGDGGYVIIPPSPEYQVADDAPMADVPEWLLPALCPPEPVAQPAAPAAARTNVSASGEGGTPYGLTALEAECNAIRRAGFGTQEHTLNAAGLKIGALVAGGELEEGPALSELLAAARSIPSQPGKPKWSISQLETKARRAFSDGKRQPREAPDRIPATPANEIHPAALLLAKLAQRQSVQPLPVSDDIMNCGGVLQLIVEECTRTAIRPQPFLALGAAICAVGVLAGRKYRGPTDLRTNFYVAAIAESGAGKDHAPEVVRRAIFEAGLGRYLGGENLASGRAVLSSLEGHPARLFQIDELGLFLRTITGKNVPGHKAEIWSELLKLYSRAKGVYGGTEYADQKQNARVNLQQPHACLYGLTTPSTFWSALEGGALLDGSLARFLAFVTEDHRPARNDNPSVIKPSERLLTALKAVAAGAAGHDYGGDVGAVMSAVTAMEPYSVPMTADAATLHRKHQDEDEDAWATRVAGTPQAAIVNRVGENAAKLALLRAISADPAKPVITPQDVAWGWALSVHCARTLLKDAERFIAETEYERKLNKALELIRRHGPVTEAALVNRHRWRLPKRDRTDVLHTLVATGMVNAIEQPGGPGGGKPTTKYVVGALCE